jgi:ABC-type transport system involved in Fe-S cluster assembly fused permease/ATPase subunit
VDFSAFETISFPTDEDIVYVLCFKCHVTAQATPFYVGESARGTRRLNDYITAQFAAPTDFKVGVVVRALQAAGAEVLIKFKRSTRRKEEEATLVQDLSIKYQLLNREPSFNYKTADRVLEKSRFEAFASKLLENHVSSGSASDA